MNLCSNDHDEVCYEGRQCPVCDLLTDKGKEIDQAQDEISNLQDRITDLCAELAELKGQLKKLEEPLFCEIHRAQVNHEVH